MSRRRRGGSDSDGDDDSFLYRYPLPSAAASSSAPGGGGGGDSGGGGGSGGLAPSKSTVYVSNLDFSLTNSDLHLLFSRFGRVARVTVLKDRDSRRSRGVAFVLFVRREDAAAAAAEMHGKVLNGRTLSASSAADNGRAAEFIRRREATATAFEDDRWASVVDTRGEEEKSAGKDAGKAKAARKEKRKGYFSDESDEEDD
ncbi:RNA binding protein [Panicum miliaceum]|uniref:RNA binding protein n=1 Tax=Panicum miliaceum TaxID=4540 RepID=A0A3L6T967_PANMI|nr:RNA binding protein [Panicum miliaceum]